MVDELRRGAFGIKKKKQVYFAHSPVNLTLEGTINADASSQLTDNLAVDSISAGHRWALSHSMRTKILSTCKEHIGLTKKDVTSHSLQKNKIQKDKKGLDNTIIDRWVPLIKNSCPIFRLGKLHLKRSF